MTGVELIGYLASVLVAASLMMVRIVRLRIVNLCGALTFAVYGFLIGSWPVAGMNAFIVGINLYHLWHLTRRRECFEVVPMEANTPFVKRLLGNFAADIAKFQPSFDAKRAYTFARIILRDGRLAGCILGDRDDSKGILGVHLDYALPEFQDFKTGSYFYQRFPETKAAERIQKIQAKAETVDHQLYLEQMGFERTGKDGLMERMIYTPS